MYAFKLIPLSIKDPIIYRSDYIEHRAWNI